MNWQERETVRKGDSGEAIVDAWLVSKGYMPYRPAGEISRPHPFDRLAASFNKKDLRIVEVKAKAARKYYPDTGIDIKHYNEYMHIEAKYGVRVFIAFVDEEKKEIYGNFLTELSKECQVEIRNGKFRDYPFKESHIIYFPLERTKKIANLSEAQADLLKKHTTKNNRYL